MKDSIHLKPTNSLFSLFQPTVGSRCDLAVLFGFCYSVLQWGRSEFQLLLKTSK